MVVIANKDQADAVRTALADVSGIDDVTEPVVKGDLVFMEGTPSAAPDSQAAKDTVDRVRDVVHKVPDADAKVGGGTAIVLDTLRAASADNKVIIPVVLLVVLLILMLLLRALVAPLVLVATVVLSFTAALGLSALVFKHVFGFAGADSVIAAVRLRVPGRTGDRLQHLLDDARARGGEGARHAARCARWGWRRPAA